MSKNLMEVWVYNGLGQKYGNKTIEIFDDRERQGDLEPCSPPERMPFDSPVQKLHINIKNPNDDQGLESEFIPVKLSADAGFKASVQYCREKGLWIIDLDCRRKFESDESTGEKTTRVNVTVGEDEPG